MVYSFNITTPKNTLLSNPLISPKKMVPGLITKFEVYFPPGSSGLMGVAIMDSNVQIFPVNRTAYFIGDDVLFSYDDRYMFDNANSEIDIYSYNTDTVYTHSALVNVSLLTEKTEIESILVSQPMGNLNKSIDKLVSYLQSEAASASSKKRKILGIPVGGGS